MRSRLFTATLSVLAAFAVSTAQSQGLVDEIPRTADGTPRLDGIWQALTEANWDIRPHGTEQPLLPELGVFTASRPGLGIVQGNELPYQEWAVAQQQENFDNRLELDPEGKCFMPGVPRATYMPYPFQILQTPDLVMVAYQYANAVRTIYMNDPGPAPNYSWMGWSVGHWEGDTLVVDVSDQVDQTWFDRAGNFHSEALHVIERYTLLGPNHIQYEATIEDSNVFTRPFTISLPLYRRVENNMELMEFKCVELVEEKIYGHLRKQTDEAEE
ncbi:MAG: hypothetical protein ACJ0SL_08380 [Candidatus Rariloculaceae bacterium]